MRHFETTLTIKASPEEVWQGLTNGKGSVDWDSGIVAFEGAIAPGNKVKLVSEVDPGRVFPLRVVGMEPARRLVLKGGMPLGLFTGVRTYTLTPDGMATRFHIREEFSGPLLNIIWRSMPDLQASFDKFAAGLKALLEEE